MFRIATGITILLLGLWLLYLAATVAWVLYIHGVAMSAIGITMVLNKKEDDIEEINERDNTQ